MAEEELEEIIEKARIDRSSILDLSRNQLTSLPESIGKLSDLVELSLSDNQLQSLPESIGQLSMLSNLNLDNNQLQSLPESFSQLSCLKQFSFQNNQLESIPASISRLFNLMYIHLSGNQLTDLTILQSSANLIWVSFLDVVLPRRYWTKLSEWNPEWLLDEENAEIRRRLIQQIGYEKIHQELDTKELDSWREYTLLKIDNAEKFYDEDTEIEVSQEPMVLLKMTCPSTGHIHILRVPPEMIGAEAAITWVNHGIHPDEFSVQT